MNEEHKKEFITIACGGIFIYVLSGVCAGMMLYQISHDRYYAVETGAGMMTEDESYVSGPARMTVEERQRIVNVVDEDGEDAEEAVQAAVVDTEPPVIEGVKDIISHIGDSIDYYEGISVWDDCDEDISFTVDSSLVDINIAGYYPVTYSAMDRAGNLTEVVAVIKIAEDAEPPVISGAEDISILLYEKYNYTAGISATDNNDTKPSLEVDDSQVNPYAEGTYSVTYSATDYTGNQTSVTIEVNVAMDPDYDWFYTAISELKEAYPDGAYWNYGGVTDTACRHSTNGTGTCNTYKGVTNSVYPFRVQGTQCLGFASMLSDAVFGTDTEVYLYDGFENIRPGDQIRLVARQHSVFVIGKADDYVIVAECNADYETCKIAWGRKITKAELESTSVLYISRY